MGVFGIILLLIPIYLVIKFALSCSTSPSTTPSAVKPVQKTITYTAPTGTVKTLYVDALKQSHLLIAGCQGSGKSVLINGLINTLLYRLPFDKAFGNNQDGAQLILIDPKRVELAAYAKLPHTLAHAAGFNPEAWVSALQKAVGIMDNRYSYMERAGLKKYDKGDLYVIIDEWAAVYKNGGRDAYKLVMRLVSEGRAARVHVIMATQVPKANIIPTEIRENFDARFCLRTANAIQSRVIMENEGCESLPRFGQGFYVTPEGTLLYKIPYIQEDEINRNIEWWHNQMKQNGITPGKAA